MSEKNIKEFNDFYNGTEFTFNDTTLNNIDGVLILNKNDVTDEIDKMRQDYLSILKASGIKLEIKERYSYSKGPQDLVLLEASFDALCEAAENACLRMPIELKTKTDEEEDYVGCIQSLEDRFLITDGDVEDFMSARFRRSALPIYKDHENEEMFFNKRLRFLLTYHILINADITDEETKRSFHSEGRKPKTRALHYMLMRGWISDYLIPHEPSNQSKYLSKNKYENDGDAEYSKSQQLFVTIDPRGRLYDTWVKKWRYQPLWYIRDYFGEKLAFYFAWSGHLITYLWLPLLIGLACFIYGLVQSVSDLDFNKYSSYNVTSELDTYLNTKEFKSEAAKNVYRVKLIVEEMLQRIKKSFDNTLTPIYACVICIWGTIFTETWKRMSARLSFEWDVNDVNDLEPDRPQFIGTEERKDPITNLTIDYFPMRQQFIRFAGSFTILLFMLLLVFGTAVSIIVYRVVITVTICSKTSSITCLFLNLILSSVLNAVAIIILGKIYDVLAVKLTDWENHRTQSAYETALIVKLFIFQFVNSYSSLVYIAFFRGTSFTKGIFNMGEEYVDTCGLENNCMAMLSFQVLVLMILKPLPKFCVDVIIPLAMRYIRKIRRSRRVADSNGIGGACEGDTESIGESGDKRNIVNYIKNELDKPTLKTSDFTRGEYMEKVLMYGYLVLFAASFPLAPVLALITAFIDIRVDASRMLWLYRRPVPLIVSNIGIWKSIVDTLNILGIVSNSFIIGFVSGWGRSLTITNRLIVTLAIEHGLLAIKLITSIIIPDIPQDVRVNTRREKYFLSIARDELHLIALEQSNKCKKDCVEFKRRLKSRLSMQSIKQKKESTKNNEKDTSQDETTL